jgi:hypothetical protein
MSVHDYGRPEPPEGVDAINTEQLREQYDVEGFAAPFVVVTRKSDGVRGLMEFTHSPRWYFNFEPTKQKGRQ